VDLIDLSHDKKKRRALVNTIMNLLDPENAKNFLTICGTAIDF